MVEDLKSRLTSLRLAYISDQEKIKLLCKIVEDLINEMEVLTNKTKV